MPALKAARTAFIFEGVKVTATVSTRSLFERLFVTQALPRRFCSATAAISNRSSSWSSSCLIALAKFVGRTYRRDRLAGNSTFADGRSLVEFSECDECSRTGGVENKSGVFDWVIRLPMHGLCRLEDRAATKSVESFSGAATVSEHLSNNSPDCCSDGWDFLSSR
jgi:hypothetical protein